MTAARHLDWEGCFNVRDLGGLPTANGRETRWRAIGALRGPGPPDRGGLGGGVRLRHTHGRGPAQPRGAGRRPGGRARTTSTTLQLPLDGTEQRDFWDEWNHWGMGTPLYYRPFLERFPRRVAAAMQAIAHAPAGGVLVHCRAGRDRTGLITMLLLSLVGVPVERIAEDHGLSNARLTQLFAELGEEDHAPQIEAYLRGEGLTAAEVIHETLTALDVEDYLSAAGLADESSRRCGAGSLAGAEALAGFAYEDDCLGEQHADGVADLPACCSALPWRFRRPMAATVISTASLMALSAQASCCAPCICSIASPRRRRSSSGSPNIENGSSLIVLRV